MHAAGSSVHRDKIGREHDRFAIKKRMLGTDLFDLASGKRFERFAGWLEVCCQAKWVHKPIAKARKISASYLGSIVRYGCSQSPKTPSRLNCSRWRSTNFRANASDFLRTASGESPPDSFTTLYSMGRP